MSEFAVLNNRIINPRQDVLPPNSVSDAALFILLSEHGRVTGNVLEESERASVKGIKVSESQRIQSQ